MNESTTNPTMIDSTITETVDNPKDTDNISHNKKKAKTSPDEDCKQNDKITSENQVNNSKNDETLITFDDTEMTN